MDQTAHNATLREVVQVLTRLAEARAAHKHGADLKFTVDEMIERHTGCHDVAAGFSASSLIPSRSPEALSTPPESASTASTSISVTSRPP
jgi:hypothetical protein